MNIVLKLVKEELLRQKNTINLIASENYPSPTVLSILGSYLTSKYAEGYPNNRYYNGCHTIDKIETLTNFYATNIFKYEFSNCQPLSGSQANEAAFNAILNEGDTILSLDLYSGAHLTHGSKVNFSGKRYNIVNFQLDQDQKINYDQIQEIALKCKPKLIICGFTSYTLQFSFERFAEIAKSVNCILLADISHIAGLVATNLHPSPYPYADIITYTTHKTLRGPRGAMIMCKDEEIFKKINKSVFPGLQGGPFCNNIAAKAQCLLEAQSAPFKKYQQKILLNINAFVNGLEVCGVQTFTSTNTHMLLIDTMKYFGIDGAHAANLLEEHRIVLNKNVLPGQKNVKIPNGIRIGTAAITTRGFNQKECFILAKIICHILSRKMVTKSISRFITRLCTKPLFQRITN